MAKQAKVRLILMGPSYHYPYFVEKIWPHIDNEQIIWLRAVDDEIKSRVFKKAKGFLSPNFNQYHEMFGIMNIEALASGVPVIGWGNSNQPSAINMGFGGGRRGEIIEHGKHGYIIEYPEYTNEARELSFLQGVGYVRIIDRIN